MSSHGLLVEWAEQHTNELRIVLLSGLRDPGTTGQAYEIRLPDNKLDATYDAIFDRLSALRSALILLVELKTSDYVKGNG